MAMKNYLFMNWELMKRGCECSWSHETNSCSKSHGSKIQSIEGEYFLKMLVA